MTAVVDVAKALAAAEVAKQVLKAAGDRLAAYRAYVESDPLTLLDAVPEANAAREGAVEAKDAAEAAAVQAAQWLGDILTTVENIDFGAFATVEQGAKADTALQPEAVGGAAALNVGTTSNTVAAGNDARIVGALQRDELPSDSLTYLRRNSGDDAFQAMTRAQVLTDLSGTVNVCHFGGQGDNGATNCRPAFEAAIAAAGEHGTVVVPVDPEGGWRYNVTEGELVIPATTRLVFEGGARLRATGGGSIVNLGRMLHFGAGAANQSGGNRVVRGLNAHVGSVSGDSSAAGEANINRLSIENDTLDMGTTSKFVNGLNVDHSFGGEDARGGRQGFQSRLIQTDQTHDDNPNRFYVGMTGQVRSLTGDGGTAGTPKGSYFGLNGWASVEGGDGRAAAVSGGEFNAGLDEGSTTRFRTGIQIAGMKMVQGATIDAAIMVGTAPMGGPAVPWRTGIHFGPQNGAPVFGPGGTYSLVEVSGGQMTGGLLFPEVTFSGDVLAAAGIRLRNAGGNAHLQLGGSTVLRHRQTGWQAATGVATRSTFATYNAPTISDPPTQAEVQALATHVQVLSRHLKALIDDLMTHGMIGE